MVSLRKRSIWISRREQKVCRLQKFDYGLKQASRSCNTHFDEFIRGNDFIKNDYDSCIYKKISGSSVAYVVLYVNNILLIGNDVKMLGNIKAWLSTQFFMKDMGEASYIIGINIYRVHQARCRLRFERNEQILGMHRGCALGRDKNTLEYLKRTKDMFLIYGGGELILESYSDASFQSDDDDAKSQSDFVFKVNGGVVAWKSFKEMVSRGDCRMDQVNSAENTADPLTKPMSQVAHTQHLDKMGLRSMGDWF
ncbi:UNVERIFIED_CONTAM: Retrovirus-related Pol polyprotein from transposon RE1 [Sesamum radiatum]|uniref:Retrovirus-related Pol polyprotein from transposon RE1 n=1 Tax=Sesamum radiatum TaxID=300843 RepID=A0AAW2R1R1_SESRA